MCNELRTRRSVTNQLGNGMHINCIGAVMAGAMLFYPEIGHWPMKPPGAADQQDISTAIAEMRKTRNLKRMRSA